MTDHGKLPAQLTNRSLVSSEKGHCSLVIRGINALKNKDDDLIYRKTRNAFNDLTSYAMLFRCGDKKRESQIAEILKLFQDLAERNYGKAFFPIFIIYSHEPPSQQSIEDNRTKAEYFRKLALDWLHANEYLKDPEIWCDLGVIYMADSIVDNNQRVSHYFKKGSDIGDANSMWLFSCAYKWGYGVEYNEDRALYWTIKAAINGHNPAQKELKFRHEDGDLDINDEQVFDWYLWSAEQGHMWAQVFLADAFADGDAIDADEEQAAYWYEKAAIQGDPHAQLQVQLKKIFSEIERHSFQTNVGLDPKLVQAGITLAGYHIEKGARTFTAYSKAMVEDMGDMIKPYLKQFYMGVKFDPSAGELANGMDSAEDVEKAVPGGKGAADILPLLTKIMDIAFRMGYAKFKVNAKFVLDTFRSKFGDEVADAVQLNHLQDAYIGIGKGSDSFAEVTEVKSLDELSGKLAASLPDILKYDITEACDDIMRYLKPWPVKDKRPVPKSLKQSALRTAQIRQKRVYFRDGTMADFRNE